MDCSHTHDHHGFHKAMSLVSAKWTVEVLHHIRQGTNRFGRLKKAIPGISSKTLAERLKALEEEGLVTKNVLIAKAPQHIEYSLTSKGGSLGSLIKAFNHWPGQ